MDFMRRGKGAVRAEKRRLMSVQGHFCRIDTFPTLEASEEVPCSSRRPNSRRAHNAACPLENYVHDIHRFLGPNFREWKCGGQRFAKRSAEFPCGLYRSVQSHAQTSLPTAKSTTHPMRNGKI